MENFFAFFSARLKCVSNRARRSVKAFSSTIKTSKLLAFADPLSSERRQGAVRKFISSQYQWISQFYFSVLMDSLGEGLESGRKSVELEAKIVSSPNPLMALLRLFLPLRSFWPLSARVEARVLCLINKRSLLRLAPHTSNLDQFSKRIESSRKL
jgi:hypothetical protein